MLVDDGAPGRRPRTGPGRATTLARGVRIPPSINACCSRRGSSGSRPHERAVAERASASSAGCSSRRRSPSSPRDDVRPAVGRSLLALVRKELVRPERSELSPGDAFKFRHILIRDAAYEALPKAERAVLHERFADWLERTVGDRLAEYEEIVGYHLEQAHAYRTELGETGPEVDRLAARAADHLVAAGLRADERRDAGTTVTLLLHAIELHGAPTPGTDELRLRVSRAMLGTGMLAEAVALDEDVRIRAAASGAGALEARATVAALEHRAAHGSPAPTSEAFRDLLEDARVVVERVGDPLATARYWRIVSTNHWNLGRWQESRTALLTALPLAERAGDPLETNELASMEFVSLLSGPTPLDVVLAHANELLARPGLDRLTRADIQVRRGLVKALLGLADAPDDIRAANVAYLDLGVRPSLADGLWHLSWIERLKGTFEQEAAWLRDGLADAEPGFAPFLNAGLALALAKLGRYEEARAAHMLANGDPWYRTVRIRTLTEARLDAVDGRLDAALRRAEDLEREVAQDTYFLNSRAELLIECGVIAELAGDHETAVRRATMALESAQAKGVVPLVAKAHALLAGDLSRL